MNFDSLSDEELALYMQQNNGQGIEILMERYEKPLLRYAKRLILDPDCAEDAIQNTFIATYQNINSYDTKRPFSPWIYRIAHNKTINEIRSHKPQIKLDEINVIPDSKTQIDINTEIDIKKLRHKLTSKIDLLPIKYKEVIVLRYFEDKNYDEISDILKIPKNTVGVRIKRGLDKLKIFIDIKYKDYL